MLWAEKRAVMVWKREVCILTVGEDDILCSMVSQESRVMMMMAQAGAVGWLAGWLSKGGGKRCRGYDRCIKVGVSKRLSLGVANRSEAKVEKRMV